MQSCLQDNATETSIGTDQPLDRKAGAKAKRTLVLPDIHHKWRLAQSIIDQTACDHVIHLGDHQDNFGDNAWQALATAKWTKSRLDAGDTILLGNHDLPYWFPNRKHDWGCGWDQDKHKIIQSVLSTEDRKKFKLWTECEGWLLSHAGFTSMYADLIPHHDIFIDETLHVGGTHPLIYHVGARRGGKGRGGGVLWCDWRDLIQEPAKKPLRQIVGHTPYPEPQYYIQESKGYTPWEAYNLDTHLNHYGIIKNGKLTIHERPDEIMVAPV